MLKSTSISLSFFDMILVLLLGFIILLFVAMLHMNPPTKKQDVPKKADLLIIVEWDKKSANDVDTWVKWMDMGKAYSPLSFRNKSTGFMHLDRDDTGHDTDTIVKKNGELERIFVNREVTVFRDMKNGTFLVNVHMYAFRDTNIPITPIKVTVASVNPTYTIHCEEEIFLKFKFDEESVCMFTIDNGKIVDVQKRPNIKFATQYLRMTN